MTRVYRADRGPTRAVWGRPVRCSACNVRPDSFLPRAGRGPATPASRVLLEPFQRVTELTALLVKAVPFVAGHPSCPSHVGMNAWTAMERI